MYYFINEIVYRGDTCPEMKYVVTEKNSENVIFSVIWVITYRSIQNTIDSDDNSCIC